MTKRLWRCAVAFALTLAAALGAGAAAPAPEQDGPRVSFENVFVAAPGELPRRVEQEGGELVNPVAPGSVVYFPIAQATRAEDLQGMRAITSAWREGEQAVETPRIQYRMVYDADGQKKLGYCYVVALTVRDFDEAQDSRVAGRVMVGSRWLESQSASFAFWVRGSTGSSASDTLLCKERPSVVLDLDGAAGELMLQFEDLARFAFDAEGQGRIDVGFSAESLTDVALRYPDIPLRFLCWEQGPIFVREGELVLYASPSELLYEVTPRGVTRLEAAYDPGEGAYRFSTRRLGCYVLAGRELGQPALDAVLENPLTNGPNGAVETQ